MRATAAAFAARKRDIGRCKMILPQATAIKRLEMAVDGADGVRAALHRHGASICGAAIGSRDLWEDRACLPR